MYELKWQNLLEEKVCTSFQNLILNNDYKIKTMKAKLAEENTKTK